MPKRPEDLPPVPTVDRYRDALNSLAYFMAPKHRQLLLKHYRAPEHTVTATELAALVNYPDSNTVNLQYGTFSKGLADRMKWQIPPTAQASYAVAWFEKPEDSKEHWRWIMHPELVAALEALEWVKPNPTS